MSTEERDESQPRPRKVISDGKTQTRILKEDLTIKVITDLKETTMNGDHITVLTGMTVEVIILMGITALMETDRVARVRMITVMAVTTNRIIAIMVETVAMATLTVKAAITADLLTVTIALMATTIVLTEMTVLMETIVRTIVRLVRAMKTEERLIRSLRLAMLFRVMV